MGGLSPTHLIIVLVIALIVLGPGKIPEAGAAVGKAVRGFRDALEGRDEVSPLPASPASAPAVAEAQGVAPAPPTAPAAPAATAAPEGNPGP